MAGSIFDPNAAGADDADKLPSIDALLDRAERLSPYEDDHLFEELCAPLLRSEER